jgi:hypothetical protein
MSKEGPFLYAPKLRPPGTATLPRGGWRLVTAPVDTAYLRPDLPCHAWRRYGIVAYDTPLCAADVEAFALEVLS